MLDFEYLATLLTSAGFVDVQRRPGGQTTVVEPTLLPPGDSSEDRSTMYVEAVKPSGTTSGAGRG